MVGPIKDQTHLIIQLPYQKNPKNWALFAGPQPRASSNRRGGEIDDYPQSLYLHVFSLQPPPLSKFFATERVLGRTDSIWLTKVEVTWSQPPLMEWRCTQLLANTVLWPLGLLLRSSKLFVKIKVLNNTTYVYLLIHSFLLFFFSVVLNSM